MASLITAFLASLLLYAVPSTPGGKSSLTHDIASLPEPSTIEKLADSLYTWGEYDAAALEYKRALYYSGLAHFLYLDSSGQLRKRDNPVGLIIAPVLVDSVTTLLKLSVSLYRNGERSEADSILYSIDGPVVRMVRAVILIGEEDPYLATRQIDSSVCASLGVPAFRLRGWAYLEAKDFESASREFSNAGDDSLAAAVAGLKPRLKNPGTARWLSILPGLGETYAGRPLFGLWALLVNAGDTYLIISNLLAARYLDAVLAYSFLWQRFYTGSMVNADRFAKQWNERKIAQATTPIKEKYNQAGDLSLDLKWLDELSRTASASR